MVSSITIDTFLPWLAQESQKAAESPRTGNYLTDQLWHVTLDALDWLRELPPDQRTAVLERVRQWLSTGQVDTLTIPADQREADCLKTILGWILNPPPVL